jgi:hypothetical protein
MKLKRSTTSWVLLLLIIALLTPTAESYADPILKPKKYHGPIPKRSFSLSIGFLGGPDNEHMYDFLDRSIDQPLKRQLQTEDFGTSPAIDAIYNVKMHPQFALRATGGVAFLSSNSTGLATASEPDTSGLVPLLEFEREFDVILFSIEGSGLYYFQDASVSEFQAYIGGGFTFFFPWATYKETTTDTGTGQPFSSIDQSKISAEPGIHGLLGALYHIRNNFALFAEGKYQIGQSKFSLDLPTAAAGVQNLKFDVHYSGFILAVGASRFF